jgi:imidazolonepropionase-like amidohydrolase
VVDPYIYPGFSLHDELALLVHDAGLTPAQAIRAATRDAAAFVGAADSLGTIERGKVADLLILDADPLARIEETRRISTVILRGKAIDPRRLLDAARGAGTGRAR